MINATIVGNLGRDAELRQTGSGPVLSFSVASAEKRKGEEQTTWVRCSLWGKRGEALARHLTKGSKVAVSGSLSTREYEGKTYLECNVNDLEFAGGKGDGGQRQQSQPGGGGSDGYDDAPPDDSDIPF